MFHTILTMFKFDENPYILKASDGQRLPNYMVQRENTLSLSNQPNVCTFSLEVTYNVMFCSEQLSTQPLFGDTT